jgi:hypothetical protein
MAYMGLRQKNTRKYFTRLQMQGRNSDKLSQKDQRECKFKISIEEKVNQYEPGDTAEINEIFNSFLNVLC